MKRIGWIIAIALVLMIPFTLAVMQDEEVITLDVIGVDANDLPAVAVNTSVLDAKGQLISGLGVENFAVGGDLADIATVTSVTNVTDDNLAFASVLVIDTSTSMSGLPIRQVQQAARNYIGALGVNDLVAIVTFDTRARLVQDYTTEKILLLNAIDTIPYGGQTALYDATLLGIQMAERAPLPRRAVVILSDGGEYGGVSKSTREDSVEASTIGGIPVYTIGLGWDIDQRFLEVISSESNAAFYESPTPDELIEIYDGLAFLFRTQYIVTLDVPVPADGTIYNFSLDVTTEDGLTASDSGTVRAPVPTPILSLPADLFTEALVDTTIVTVDVNADDDIASVEYRIDEDVVSTSESYTIEPATTAPGTYTLDVTVTDVDGDVGTLSADYTIAALPPTTSSDFAPETGVEISEPTTVTVTAGGQTDITGVDFLMDGVIVLSDTEAPYEYTIEPFKLAPGGHILTITANNAGGQSTSTNTAFAVATLPPEIAVSGLTAETVLSDSVSAGVLAVGQSNISDLSVNAGDTVIASAVDTDTLDFTLNAVDFAPGTGSVDITATDANGATITQTVSFAVAALPPTVEITGLTPNQIIIGDVTVTVNGGGQTEITLIDVGYDDDASSVIVGTSFVVPAETLGDGAHDVTVIVTNAGGQSTSVTVPFVVNLPPTPTFTPSPTNTPSPTLTPEPTDTSELTDTVEPSDTPDATETAVANAQVAEEATADAQATIEAENTDTPEPTDTVEATDTDEPTETDTEEPTETDTEEPTETDTEAPSDTPEPTDTDTKEPTETDTVEPTETDTVESTETDTEEPTKTDTEEPTETPEPTNTPSPTPDATETAVAVAQIAEQETADAQATVDAEQTAIAENATATVNAQETADAQATEDFESTQIAENVLATANARSTQQALDATETFSANEEATENAQLTLVIEETVNALETTQAEERANALATTESEEATAIAADVEPTVESGETEVPTDEPTDESDGDQTEIPATSTESPTEDGVDDPTAQPTLTPVTIVEVDAQSADPQETTDNTTAIVAIGGGLLLLLLFFLGLRRRGQ